DHVDQLAQLFQPFLMDDPEAVFLVHDYQAQIFELDILLQQPVRSDQDIDAPLGGLWENLRYFLRGQETTYHFNTHRMIAKPMAKRLEMLLRQNRCRRQHRDLLTTLHSEKSGPHGHFSLAIADVAADQAIHRLSALHAGQGLVDGA